MSSPASRACRAAGGGGPGGLTNSADVIFNWPHGFYVRFGQSRPRGLSAAAAVVAFAGPLGLLIRFADRSSPMNTDAANAMAPPRLVLRILLAVRRPRPNPAARPKTMKA